jgi:acetoin utilization deacetylase AcuC-like enzyme
LLNSGKLYPQKGQSMENLVLFYPVGHEKHFEHGHPERPDRVEAIKQKLESEGVWEMTPKIEPLQIPESVLHKIHHPGYLSSLKRASESGQRIDMDTYVTLDSWQLALNAAGGGIALAKEVWNREAKRGFALCRPPGHHATENQAMGFCLLNNVAIASEYLKQIAGAERLAIIDIDLHHGNGTQDIFWERGDVFFFSIHQYPLYPLSGTLEETKPDMILMSVGFDAHWKDPLGHQLASSGGYADIVRRLSLWADTHCQGRIAIFLEGGYDLEAGATSALAITQALLGKSWKDPLGKSSTPEDGRWVTLVEQAKQLWRV